MKQFINTGVANTRVSSRWQGKKKRRDGKTGFFGMFVCGIALLLSFELVYVTNSDRDTHTFKRNYN